MAVIVKYGIAQHASSSPFACEIITADTAAACPQHIGAQRQAALTRASDKPLSDKRARRTGQALVWRQSLPHSPLYPPLALSPERVSHLISRVRVQHPDRSRLSSQLLGAILRSFGPDFSSSLVASLTSQYANHGVRRRCKQV